MKDVLEYVARGLVDEPDAVRVEEEESEGRLVLRLTVAPGDMGKVIGRGGRTARAIRGVLRAAGARDDVRPHVEIVE